MDVDIRTSYSVTVVTGFFFTIRNPDYKFYSYREAVRKVKVLLLLIDPDKAVEKKGIKFLALTHMRIRGI